jgi:vacuolar-type H+-ATPase subunit F/Vma7
LYDQIAIVGNPDSISYFRILGCRCFETEEGELTGEVMEELKSGGFEIIFVTEEIFEQYRDFFRDGKTFAGTAVTIIPDIRVAGWEDGKPKAGRAAAEEIRQAVIRAVGQDLSGSGE